MAVDLRCCYLICQKGKGLRWIISRLCVQSGPVDGPPVETRRCTGFQPAETKTRPTQSIGQSNAGCLTHATRRDLFFTHMDQTTQKGPRCKNDATAGDCLSSSRHNGLNVPLIIKRQIFNGTGLYCQAGLFSQYGLHGGTVKFAIRLRPWAPHSRALAEIQHTELNAGPIGNTPHHAVQRINLTHQVTLGQPADRGIAGHFSDCLNLMGQQ